MPLTSHIRFFSSPSPLANEKDPNATSESSPLQPVYTRAIPRPSGKMYDFLLHTTKETVARTKSPDEVWKEWELTRVNHLVKPSNAYSGRSIPVGKYEAGSAYIRLMRIIRNNKLIREMVAARRHEKKGEKRRRLKSERWRRRFAHEVRKKVQLVNEIRARGS
ncbi:hypothetical protein BKA93DRAFT_821826 [Sparassis latifolia]